MTDQNGKQRIVQTNALQLLKDVWEITAAGPETEAVSFAAHSEVTAGYHTSYAYDVFNQLTTVTQGSQTRIFVYDSLRRLVGETSPEKGNVGYQYDEMGNLLVMSDARGVSTHISYDSLNRPIRRWYNASSSISATTHNTPTLPAEVGVSNEVSFFYDAQGLPTGAPGFARGPSTGRVVAMTYGGGSSGDYYGYDTGGSAVLKIQQTGGVNYQVTVGHNASGRITSKTYPSEHTVSYDYDEAGRTKSFTGKLGDGIQRNYSTQLSYSAFGGLSQEQFGTATPIYNKLFYNVRGQLAEIREGITPNNSNWERGAIINFYGNCWGMCPGQPMPDNNGNLKRQEHWVQDSSGNVVAINTQEFEYDSLNRIKRVSEGAAWQQTFIYDRYGNHRVDVNGTSPSLSPRAFEVQTNTNQLLAPGDTNLAEPNRQMRYDNVGNLTKDSYTSQGQRTYDAANHMTGSTGVTPSTYSYDGAGQRVRRNINGVETWQVYGLEGELIAEYAANGGATTPQKEYGYRNGQLLITAEPPAQSSNTASFIISDTTTQGNWKGVYGADGYNVINDATSYPSYATVTVSGQSSYTWAAATSDSRALRKAASTTDRLAACWYSGTNFTIDVNLTDGNSHQAALYTIDWDGSDARQERIEVLDAGTNAVLDTRDVNVYTTGKYLVWMLRGHVKLKFTHLSPAGYSAVVSGLFFDPPALSFITSDTTTQGNWKGVYGADGYNVINDATNYPSYATVTVSGQSSYTWAAATSDSRALRKAASTTDRLAACWYSGTNFTIDVNLTDGNSHQVALYTIDWDGSDARQERIEVLDAGTNAVLDTRDVNVYTTGKYLVWMLRGHVKLKFTHLSPAGYSAVVSGLFFGSAGSGTASINWLVSDQLGTPRMIFDKTGSLAATKRHDYLPFGEALLAGGRATTPGYGLVDGVRQNFTSKERDNETGLDFFEARYYASMHGRFTSPDEPFADQSAENPQSWNLYSYVRNNPLIMVDPTGRFGDFYNTDGSWAYTDNINDNRVYVLNQTREPDGSINLEPQLLPITHTEFTRSASVVRHEGVSNDANEYLWIAHTSNNEANAINTTLPNLLQTGFSSAPANVKNTGIPTADVSVRANAARAGILEVESGGADPTGGARRWDGTDFLARGSGHNKFREFDSIHISGQIFFAYENAQYAMYGHSVRFSGRNWALPDAVFTNAANWTQNRDFHYATGARYGIGNLVATGARGLSIFWRF